MSVLKRLLSLLFCLFLLVSAHCEDFVLSDDEEDAEPLLMDLVDHYEFCGKVKQTYQSDTLHWQIEEFTYEKATCLVVKIWMSEPGRQIRKATGQWKKSLSKPEDMAKSIPEATLVINGSGYVSPTFPEIYDNYPGSSPDYYYTPLGSVTVTDGEVFRQLEGVPYYGLTLQQDGLHLHVGEDPASVLAQSPTQTWSFYVECPVILHHQSILDLDWKFTNTRHLRNIISQIDEQNYVLLLVTKRGLTMAQCVAFLQENFDPDWTYNLDGGPSIALYTRKTPGGSLKRVAGGTSKDHDIMAFTD